MGCARGGTLRATLGKGLPKDGQKELHSLPTVPPKCAACSSLVALSPPPQPSKQQPLTSGRRWLYCCAVGVISSIWAPCPFLALFQPMATMRRPALAPLPLPAPLPLLEPLPLLASAC